MKIDIVRAWKDAEYRNSLTAEQRASLPPNPAELTEAEAAQVTGGLHNPFVTIGGPKRCGTNYPECCYNSTIGPGPVAP